MNRWKEVWAKRTLSDSCKGLQELIYADGFDSGAGKIDIGHWKDYVTFIYQKIGVKKNDSIFEVGCGCGAFLYLFYGMGHKVGGIDYSASLIKIAEDTIENMDFKVCEAIDIDTREKYDIVISNGVFHYFPDLNYSESVVKKMLDKCKRAIAILEIPNLVLKEESENVRRGALLTGEYKKKYEGLGHLYYEKDWFYEIGEKYNCGVEMFDQNIKNYGNNNFRFNVIMRKNG